MIRFQIISRICASYKSYTDHLNLQHQKRKYENDKNENT